MPASVIGSLGYFLGLYPHQLCVEELLIRLAWPGQHLCVNRAYESVGGLAVPGASPCPDASGLHQLITF